jgi:hypothetical protein
MFTLIGIFITKRYRSYKDGDGMGSAIRFRVFFYSLNVYYGLHFCSNIPFWFISPSVEFGLEFLTDSEKSNLNK